MRALSLVSILYTLLFPSALTAFESHLQSAISFRSRKNVSSRSDQRKRAMLTIPEDDCLVWIFWHKYSVLFFERTRGGSLLGSSRRTLACRVTSTDWNINLWKRFEIWVPIQTVSTTLRRSSYSHTHENHSLHYRERKRCTSSLHNWTQYEYSWYIRVGGLSYVKLYIFSLLLMFVNFHPTYPSAKQQITPTVNCRSIYSMYICIYIYVYIYMYIYISSVCIVAMSRYVLKLHVLEIRWTLCSKETDHSFVVQYDRCTIGRYRSLRCVAPHRRLTCCISYIPRRGVNLLLT